MSSLRAAAKRFEANRPPGRLLGRDGAAPHRKDTCRSTAGVLGVFRGRPLAIPLGYPTPPREKVSLRSPLSDGDKTSSGTELPIYEATTEERSPPWALIDKSPGRRQSFCLRVSLPAVQPAGIINILLSTMQAHVPQKGGRANPSAQTIIAKIVVSWYTGRREHCHNGRRLVTSRRREVIQWLHMRGYLPFAL